ncbi:MAG: class I SAM-dependent methyltransferase [Desulfobacteraceae bacterium]|nr:class I SAM-dependent methyltransferase [Desulfobacteraceae bacterium]
MMIDTKILNTIKGFMDDAEAVRLFELAYQASKVGPVLEIGSYCGRSAAIIGTACQKNNGILYSIDHHRGSEEQQPGEEYFDPELFDERVCGVNTLPFFRETLKKTNLEDTVIPIVSTSIVVGKMWQTPLSMVFVDGGHSFDAAYNDFLIWSPYLMTGGLLVIHDIFLDQQLGGQAPRQVYEKAIDTGLYIELAMTKTLGVLQRK